MINTIRIQNFKSVVDLSLDLGVFNVIIGENGSGKSNILEAIAFGAAASADKLDYEFLGSRGIRVANREFMFSAFTKDSFNKIHIRYDVSNTFFNYYDYLLEGAVDNPREWTSLSYAGMKDAPDQIQEILKEEDDARRRKYIEALVGKDDEYIIDHIEQAAHLVRSMVNSLEELDNNIISAVFHTFMRRGLNDKTISKFIIYSPEQSSLRKFEETSQIYPLGIKGEGLFQYLKEISLDQEKKEMLQEIKESLLLLDWYEGFEVPENAVSNEFSLQIKDKYVDPTLKYFDQRSTNEGFLYLLFFSTLFISDLTPSFFAIDNIDASFNPKLCMRLTKHLISLAKKHNKQVIVTTQNPAILDGLDLSDNDQRLFVVRRNDEGHTKATRIDYKPERKVKLSEAWTGGYIGGLPDNF